MAAGEAPTGAAVACGSARSGVGELADETGSSAGRGVCAPSAAGREAAIVGRGGGSAAATLPPDDQGSDATRTSRTSGSGIGDDSCTTAGGAAGRSGSGSAGGAFQWMRRDDDAVPVGLPCPETCAGGAFHTIRGDEADLGERVGPEAAPSSGDAAEELSSWALAAGASGSLSAGMEPASAAGGSDGTESPRRSGSSTGEGTPGRGSVWVASGRDAARAPDVRSVVPTASAATCFGSCHSAAGGVDAFAASLLPRASAIAAASDDRASAAGAPASDTAGAGDAATAGAASRARCQLAVVGWPGEAVTVVAAGGGAAAVPVPRHAPARSSPVTGFERASLSGDGSAARASREPLSAGDASAAGVLETAGAGSGRSEENQVIRVDRVVSVCKSERTGACAAATSLHRGAEEARATTADGAEEPRLQRADDAGCAIPVLLSSATAADGAVRPLFHVVPVAGTAGRCAATTGGASEDAARRDLFPWAPGEGPVEAARAGASTAGGAVAAAVLQPAPVSFRRCAVSTAAAGRPRRQT